MSYIPKEAQDRIDELEDRLFEADQNQQNAIKQTEALKSRLARTRTGIIAALLVAVAGLGFGLYRQFKPAVVPDDAARRALAIVEQRADSLQRYYSLQTETSALDQGVWYLVQIGAYKNLDLRMFEQGTMNFRIASDDSLVKYTLGSFRELGEAEQFLASVRDMGIRDAFLLAFRDGNRVTIEESKVEP